MNYREWKAPQKRNSERLRDLGLPPDLFSEGLQEREAAAKRLELVLVRESERRSLSGEWGYLSLPFEQIIARWRAAIASPTRFASIGPSPRWKKALNTAREEWVRINSGRQRMAWREHRRKQIYEEARSAGKTTAEIQSVTS
jgi:hypothetical protein